MTKQEETNSKSPTPEEVKESLEEGFIKHVLPLWKEWKKLVYWKRY